MPHKLVLIDGHALLYRAYHALPQTMVTSKGESTNAVYGFVSTLLKVLGDERPEYVVVCLDRGRTFRHEMYQEYKAHRAKMPDDMRGQIGRTEEVLHALGIPTVGVEGFEADDLIGTLAHQATEAGLETLIVTGDSDALQLVDEQVNVLVPGRKYAETVCYDVAGVRAKYGFDPRQVVEFKALRGDTSDNIPGVPGVGDKTAEDLVKRFGNLEGIYQNIDLVPSRYREPLEKNHDQAFFSRDLATIRTNAPVKLELEQSRFGVYDRDAVVQLFRELEFRSLLNRLPEQRRETAPAGPTQLSLFGDGDYAAATAAATTVAASPGPAPANPSYTIVRDTAALDEMVAALGHGPLALDTETDSLKPMEAGLVGMSLAVEGGRAWYIPLNHRGLDGHLVQNQLPWEEVRAVLAPLMADPAVVKYAHHAKFDTLILAEHGLEVQGLTFDTMIAAYLLGERSVGLKDLAFRLLGVEMREIGELLGKGKSQKTMDQVDIAEAGPYAAADADMTFRLQVLLAPRLEERGLQSLFQDIEMPLAFVLRDMERAGIRLDVASLQEMSRELNQSLEELQRQIYEMAGHAFNVNSTQQLGEVLFQQLRLPTTATTRLKSGAYSTAIEVMEKLRGLHPIVDAVLNQRELAKLKSTYLDALPLLVNRRTGRVHTSFNQTIASTGRLSSSDPNLQNIPIRTELGRRVRDAFVADPGWLLLSADYSQVELRILAHLSGDTELLKAFARGEDIHASTAAKLFNVPEGQAVTSEQRRIAKTVNFGVLYGMSEYGLAARLGIENETASRFINNYFGRYPSVRQYLDKTLQQGRELGYVSTLLGRRRYVPELSSLNRNVQSAAEREAINAPIQGTAADIIKIAMVRLHRELRSNGMRSRMLLQVHDELVLEVPQEEMDRAIPLVTEVMENAYPLDVPLKVDVHTGPDWGELK